MTDDQRIHPCKVADDRAMLISFLGYQRATLAMKCAGLTGKQLKLRAIPTSGLTLLGLVRHAASVERSWFRFVMNAEDVRPPWPGEVDGTFAEFHVEDADVDEAFEVWHEECARARAVAASLNSLDDNVGFRGEAISLRYVLTHVIEEYARHNGHADLLREAIDGVVGEQKEAHLRSADGPVSTRRLRRRNSTSATRQSPRGDHVMAAVTTASELSWIAPFTGGSPRCFGKLVTALRREGADPMRRGRPWSLPLEDRLLPVAAYWRTNLTLHQLAPLFGVSKSTADRIIDHLGPILALQPRRRFRKDTVLIVDGTLVPTRDHQVAEQSKNYRYSTAHQVVIDADTRLVVVIDLPLPGNRHDSRGWEESGARAAVGNTMTIADGGYQGLVIPHRRRKGEELRPGRRNTTAPTSRCGLASSTPSPA